MMKKFIRGFSPHHPHRPQTTLYGQDRGTRLLCRVVFVSLIFVGGGCAVGSSMDQAIHQAGIKRRAEWLDRTAREAERYAFVHGQYVSSPKGKLLLIRRGQDLCAVRVTAYRRGHDAGPRTFFSTGKETTYAEYDWVFQGDGSGDLTKSNVESGHDELSRGAFVGISFHLSMELGNFDVECGEWKFWWAFPTAVSFDPVPKPYTPEEFEMAPTNWAQVSEIDLQDPRLRWYSHHYGANATREDYIEKLIPAEDLPGGQAASSTPAHSANPKD
ncbi:MAG: hypothetical protein R3B74_12360 [Nitrospirales bacterium]|nr:hypothetical protein [Nitrospirales bacterium]